jgi:pimeloyl-ACP methyl ester carboxylesterase/DNA-binding CsgD family transcriptional regulator
LIQRVRFCHSSDGVRIAYALHGSGRPLVRTATWLTHLEFDWGSPLWRHWLEGLADGQTVVRYDERGCGLSDRDVTDFSLDARVADLEAVVDSAGLDEFALLGMSQGGPVAVAFAARHPERVTQLVLCATFARGRLRRDRVPEERERAQLVASLIRVGWAQDEPTFRRLFTTLFVPDATAEQMRWFDELQRVSSSADTAVRIRAARNGDDVTAEAAIIRCPTLVLHARHDPLVPFAEGRLLATLIPGAQFVPLESRNHVLLAGEPGWDQFRSELRSFLGPVEPSADDDLAALSPREIDVLELVAAGLSNEEIRARLHLSVRTVERHLSNIYAKLSVSGKAARAGAAARYTRSRAWTRTG